MTRRAMVTLAGMLCFGACVKPTSQFDRYMADGNWSGAAREFAADSSLRDNERALYQAGVLFGTPGRPTYDPRQARELLTRLVVRFPMSDHQGDVNARLLLLDEVASAQRAAATRERALEAQIASLTRETRELRARADSVSAQSDSLRSTINRLEAERRDREEQLRALRLELQRLKEIDLKPRPPVRPIKP